MIKELKELRDALAYHVAQTRPIERTDQAIAKLDALIAQRESGDDGLAQQYTKLSAHCKMLEDKLAAQEKAEPVAQSGALKDAVYVAIAQLFEQHQDDALRTFTLDELQQIADYTDALRPKQVEAIYRVAFDASNAAPQPAPSTSPLIDKRCKIKLGAAYGDDLCGQWFFLQPSDQPSEDALTRHSGLANLQPHKIGAKP